MQWNQRKEENILWILTYSDNGTRFTISNALYSELNIEDDIYIGISVESNVIVLSKNGLDNTEKYKINRNGIIYNKVLVEGIVNAFNLNEYYEKHTSTSFSDIEIENEVALIKISKEEGEYIHGWLWFY